MSGHQELRERIARALHRHCWPGDDRNIAPAAFVAQADAVLDSLGLEQVGWLDPDGGFWEGAANTHGLTPLYRLRGEP